jgi:hypothetical protein
MFSRSSYWSFINLKKLVKNQEIIEMKELLQNRGTWLGRIHITVTKSKSTNSRNIDQIKVYNIY